MNEDMIVPEWEWVTANLYRLPVPGGWLYREHDSIAAFVPDPSHHQKMMERAVYNALMWLLPSRQDEYYRSGR